MSNQQQLYDRYKRDKESKKFYNSTAWIKCRALALRRDYYICTRFMKDKNSCVSFQNGKSFVMADMVHHIKPREDHPELSLTLSNLESLCNACHNKEHPEKGGGKKKVSKQPRVNVVEFKANQETT
ncbi:HNH endonuclease [Virgibacillus phage Mimir87]|nr:HNH endonuclease [Virgibacillus phage Mimir87]